MKKTSFGEMEVILELEGKTKAEFLQFEKSGRSHSHAEYETFFVVSGKGKVFSGDDQFLVKPGDLVTIPPHTKHWMVPAESQVMQGLLWYHEQPTQLLSK